MSGEPDVPLLTVDTIAKFRAKRATRATAHPVSTTSSNRRVVSSVQEDVALIGEFIEISYVVTSTSGDDIVSFTTLRERVAWFILYIFQTEHLNGETSTISTATKVIVSRLDDQLTCVHRSNAEKLTFFITSRRLYFAAN